MKTYEIVIIKLTNYIISYFNIRRNIYLDEFIKIIVFESI